MEKNFDEIPEEIKARRELEKNLDDSIKISPDSPITFKGKMPPQMEEAMKKLKMQKQQQQTPPPQAPQEAKCETGACAVPQPQKKPKKTSLFETEWQSLARPQGSTKLEELIEGLKPKLGIYKEITLPSMGKFYNGEDGPTNGILHIKAMTGEEEQILASPNLARKGQNINMIFENCIKESFKAENLLSADRNFLLIYLRSFSYSPEYEIEVKCPDTNQKFTHKINLEEDLMINYCPEDFGPNKLSGVLPNSEYSFKYRLPRGKDDVAIQDYKEWYSKKHGNTTKDDTLIFRTAMLLQDIEGLTDRKELMTLIKKLPIQDVAYLRSLTTNIPFGVDTKITIYSPYSMNEFEIDLPYESGFFFPIAKRETEEK